MRTREGWLISVLSMPFIALDFWAAWAIITAPPPPDCGPFPSCADVPTTNPPIFLLGAAVSAALGMLGVFGIDEFARRGATKWSSWAIAGTVVWWTAVVLIALLGGGLRY